MKYYLAGPMSGMPQFNFPAFYAAAQVLRAGGLVIVSPAELDDAEDAGAAMSSVDGDPVTAKRTWGDFLARDVKLIADQCDGVIFLPGWEKSRGARLEAFTALLSGKKRFGWYFADGACKVSWGSEDLVRSTLKENMP